MLMIPVQTVKPDIANFGKPSAPLHLEQVGMTEIEIPVMIQSPSEPKSFIRIPARADAFVSLDHGDVKGIHMSRLYLALHEILDASPLDFGTIRQILDKFCQSHLGLSLASFIKIRFDYPLKRPSLISRYEGWRSYPVVFSGSLSGQKYTLELDLQVTYSSTCPCSAALARQLIQEKFEQDFHSQTNISKDEVKAWLGEDTGILATPHGQRSHGNIKIVLGDHLTSYDFATLIEKIENALGTPVQTAVKREDEQEFARLNGQNLMFAEDAVRKMAAVLDEDPDFKDFEVEAVHFESLHPHNAVARTHKHYGSAMATPERSPLQ